MQHKRTDDAAVARMTLKADIRTHENWPSIRKYLLENIPEINPYKGTPESLDTFVRESYQREGYIKVLNLLGVNDDG